jgi:DNA invertase Pin-like site-specific DNA recombinase
MSIESQRMELARVFDARSDIQIVGAFEESKSAKTPGRPVFGAMMERLEAGGADGIIAWAPDRLARNSIDGGRIIYDLDTGALKDLKFPTYTFENSSQGKFMLAIMFGQSKYYSDALSENVKRGNRTKIANGWRPNLAPLGYLNDKATKTIVPDPAHFPLVRRMFELMLTGAYTPKQIALIARDEWSFRTPRRRKIGGVPLAMSSIYKILSNPFYAGLIPWAGQLHQGRHEPVVSIAEFEQVRALIALPSRPRLRKELFTYTGLIRCGRCGLMITAEHKTNRFGSRYVYYHCSKRRLEPRCPEPSIEGRALEGQIVAFLRTLTVAPEIAAWITSQLQDERDGDLELRAARRASLERARNDVRVQLSELTGLRLRTLVSDEEFVSRRLALEGENLKIEQQLATLDTSPENRFEPLSALISFNNQAVEFFAKGSREDKRMILQTACSNPTLRGRILSIEAAKPFVLMREIANSPSLLACVDANRTPASSVRRHAFPPDIRRKLRRLRRELAEDPKRVAQLRGFADRFLPSDRANASL